MTPRRVCLLSVECLLIAALPVVFLLKLLALPYIGARRLYDRVDAWLESQS